MLLRSPRASMPLGFRCWSMRSRRRPYPDDPPWRKPSSISLHCPAKTLTERSRLNSPAMARLIVLMIVDGRLPSLTKSSAQLVDVDIGPLAKVFVVGALVRVLKASPSAHIVDQDHLEGSCA